MIGTRVSLVPPAPTVALACIGGAVALGVLTALATANEVLPFAVLPLAIGLFLLFGDDRRFLARFTPGAVEIARPAQSIPYSSLLEVRPIAPLGAARPRSFPIEVVHQRGSVTFPATLTAPSERVYSFLRGHLAEKPARVLPESLATYQREQEQAFSADRVFCYGGRRGPFRHDATRWGAVGKGLLVTAAVWGVLALVRPSVGAGWYVAAGLALLIGGVCLVAGMRGTGHAEAMARTSGAALVVSPVGLAMQQDTLNGHLTWQQIRKVSVQVPGKGITFARVIPGIQVEVEGATFVITDSYDRPLSEIHERILKYWK